MEVLKKLNIEVPCDPAIPLLGEGPEKTNSLKDTCTPNDQGNIMYKREDMKAT